MPQSSRNAWNAIGPSRSSIFCSSCRAKLGGGFAATMMPAASNLEERPNRKTPPEKCRTKRGPTSFFAPVKHPKPRCVLRMAASLSPRKTSSHLLFLRDSRDCQGPLLPCTSFLGPLPPRFCLHLRGCSWRGSDLLRTRILQGTSPELLSLAAM